MLIDGVSFHSEDSIHKWKYVIQHRIADELNISNKHQSYTHMIDLIKNVGFGPFYSLLIRELVVNLPSDFNNPSVDEFHKVHIREVCFTIFLDLLNQLLGCFFI